MLVLGTAGCGVLDSTASATESETRSISVHYNDLDISRPRDMETLKRRIHQAAGAVCGDPYEPELRLSPQFLHCVDVATNNALAEVKSRSKRGEPHPQLLSGVHGAN
jgi:UrcA family protein